MAVILNSAVLDSAILHKKKTSLIHSDSTWWWQPSWILAMLDSDTAILDSDTLLSSLSFTQKHSPSTLTLTQTNSIWLKLIHSHLTWWWQPSRILAILDSAISTKKNFPHAFSLKLMMAAILNSAILDSANLHKKIHLFILTQLDNGSHLEICHLGFSFSTKKNFTHAFSLNFMMATILKSAIMDLAILHKKTSLIHSHSTWWWQPYWILPSWIQPFCTKKLHSCILTQLNDGSHLEFCHHGFSHFAQKNFTHSFWLNLMISAILNSAMLDSDTAILDSNTLLSCSFRLNFMKTVILNSAILGFSHLHKKNFTHSIWLNWMMATILNSAILDSDTALLHSNTFWSSLRFTQKHSPSTLTLNQTHSILTQLDNGNKLEFFHIEFCHLGFSHFEQNSDSN